MKNIKIGLIEGRHDLPVKNYIFKTEDIDFESVDLFDTLYSKAWDSFQAILEEEKVGVAHQEYESDRSVGITDVVKVRECTIQLYVTGYTPALKAALRAAKDFFVEEVILMHYDVSKKGYVPQVVYLW